MSKQDLFTHCYLLPSLETDVVNKQIEYNRAKRFIYTLHECQDSDF
jgi:hypothetical protein